jgi:hypothetical protein
MTISSRRIRKIYNSLDKEQIQLVIDKKIEGTLAIDQWLEKLRKLAVMDSLGDDSRKKSAELSIIFGLISAFTILLSINKPFLFFFPLGFSLLFFYFLIMYITLNKIDIGNNLRYFIVPLLEHYKVEDRINHPVYLKMDFSNPKDPKNAIKKADDPGGQGIVFRHHWMDGEMIFTDKVIVRWKIDDIVSESGRTIKEKTRIVKNRVKHELEVEFLIPKNGFHVEKQELELSDTGEHYTFSLKRADISESLQEGMVPRTFIEAISAGYQHIRKKEVRT